MGIDAIFVWLLGCCIGSFLHVCIYRIPRGESISWPPSHCPACGQRLGMRDLIPVFSFLWLRGRCSYCKARISYRYLLLELLTGFLYLMMYFRWGYSWDAACMMFLVSIMLVVFFIDLRHFIIPNRVVAVGAVVGAAAAVHHAFSPHTVYMDTAWWNPLAGAAAGYGSMLLVALAGTWFYKNEDAMGMGDVKIYIPIGLFLGWRLVLLVLLLSFVLGGLTGIGLMVTGKAKAQAVIPFGPFIAAAVCMAVFWGPQLIQWYMGG